ncbi:MAG: GtrA family protein [gamma proteobacterium symbiont of Ctena orbiculata]|nr:GtrA family protein [Candidatus Thiodiazotropha taylori]MBT3058268.1 GtrA family protein [Candidatus Thiodiazotropha sp. (ex Lucina pensylvanica)]MBV2096418.1 GtrA family protein [Candidatus Thiodiazotropha sp. (ex Codakia orbicularis)]PUB74423.1 MAG: GtrA family protein [gamma proteobacterium symbiont of Ctena orbiculata]MBT3062899.1 GtrA family protein [Candidatus Thiodiazotropha sp. (ex Lucina pensylvanica)]
MRQIGMFAVAGSVGYLVDVTVLLLANLFLGPHLGRLFSFTAAVVATWLINRKHTFSNYRESSLITEFSRYFTTALGGGVVNLLIYSTLVKLFDLTTLWLPVAVAVGALAGMLVNFMLAKHFVFTYPK